MAEMEKIILDEKETTQQVKEFCLFDDALYAKCFDGDTRCVELVTQIILEKSDLKVLDTHTMMFPSNHWGHSVRTEVLAIDGTGLKYNIIIQRNDAGDDVMQSRCNMALIQTELYEKNAPYDRFPEGYAIFITKRDAFGRGVPVYKVESFCRETGTCIDDGTHIRYVNGACRDESTPIGKLIHDFYCTNPEEMYYGVMSERVKSCRESLEKASNRQAT